MKELREMVSRDTGIEEKQIILTEVDGDGFHRTFNDCQPLSVLGDGHGHSLYAIEMPELKDSNEMDGAFVLLLWVNKLAVSSECSTRFGSPYMLQVSRETNYADLQKLLVKEMSQVVYPVTLVTEQDPTLFSIFVSDGSGSTLLDPSLDHPLYAECVEQALELCDLKSGPMHVKLILDWSESTKEKVFCDDSDSVEEHESVKQLENTTQQAQPVTLDDCFELYTTDEWLGPDNAWHCPTCNRKQEGAVKRLALWSLPDILVIHLKRFRQTPNQRNTTKLMTEVEFPMYGLDMSRHLTARNGSQLVPAAWSPWRRVRQTGMKPDDNIYELYAVCNHHGRDLQGGHYTAFCKNSVDGKWYCFDDVSVEPVEDADVFTSDAYILFYQRQSLSVDTQQHWVYGMPMNTSSRSGKWRGSKFYRSMLTLPLNRRRKKEMEKSTTAPTTPATTLERPKPNDKKDADSADTIILEHKTDDTVELIERVTVSESTV